MHRAIVIAFLVLTASGIGSDTVFKGYLVDASCSVRKTRKPGSVIGHSRACLRMRLCEESGYGLLTDDNRFIKFDHNGDEKAKTLIRDMTKESDIKVVVSGTVEGDRITVAKIELQ